MSDEQAFLDAIAATPDDEAPHKVFADWLDEHDRPEEADWHRAWTPERAAAARAWFETFVAGHYHNEKYGLPGNWWDEAAEAYLSAADAIRAGRDWLDAKARDDEWGGYFTQMGSESLRDVMSSAHAREEFWRNFALATGTYVPGGVAEDGYVFSCSC